MHRLSCFLDDLELKDLGGERWGIVIPLRFYSAVYFRTFKVPSGTVTDLASIPRIIWNILPKSGKYNRAAVLHDGAYNDLLIDILGNPLFLAKKEADGLFLEAMLA